MKTLYESILDNDLEQKTDTMMDMFGTTKKVFSKMKHGISPIEFGNLRDNCIDGSELNYSLSKEESYAVRSFIQHMHSKYGQQDIFATGWCLGDYTWQLYEINKGMNSQDKSYLLKDLNLPMNISPAQIDQWIAGIDEDAETSWFVCTLKKMTKVEKETWLEIMKAIERYFN